MRATTRIITVFLALCAALAASGTAQAAAYTASCPSNKVVTGIKGKLGGYMVFWTVLGEVQPTCRSVTAEGSWVDEESNGTSGGTGEGNSWSLECDPNHAVTGISGMKGDVIDSIEIQCSPIPTWMRAGSNFPGMSDGPAGGGNGVDTYSSVCASTNFGNSLAGDESFGVINSIGLNCQAVPWGDVEDQPSNYFPENEQALANLTPEFQWAPIVNAHNYHVCVTSGSSDQPCDSVDDDTETELQAQFSRYTPQQPLDMGNAAWGTWKVQACNGAGECGPWSMSTSFLVPIVDDDDDDDVVVEDPCVGNDVTFFGNGTPGDLCSVYQNIRCQNCHSETFRERDTVTPPVGNHFPAVDSSNENCETCHIRNHPGDWFTPANQDFEKTCGEICADLTVWAQGHDIAEHLSNGFDPRIEWSFDPSGFSTTDHEDTKIVPAVTEMTYPTFISTSQAWIAGGMCCGLVANGSGAGTTGPDDRRGDGSGGDGGQGRERRRYLKWLDQLPRDFRNTPFPKTQIDPPRPDPRFSDRSLRKRKAVDRKGQPLSIDDQRALRDAGLRADASRGQVEAALARLRSGAKVDPGVVRPRTAERAVPRQSVTRTPTRQRTTMQKAVPQTAKVARRRPAVRMATSSGRPLDRALSLDPAGDKSASITLKGSNLGHVKGVRVVLDGRPVRDVVVRVRRKSADALDLDIRVANAAKLDDHYEIELETASGRVAVPPQTFKIQVRKKGGSRDRR